VWRRQGKRRREESRFMQRRGVKKNGKGMFFSFAVFALLLGAFA
jgi:hypothetical protein